MARLVPLGVALGALLALPACAELMALTKPDAAVTASVAPPAARVPSAAPDGIAEEPTVGWVTGLGFVRGTPTALARAGKPLPAARGDSRMVEGCRAMVEAEARKLGARSVEAAAAGPQVRDRLGRASGPILVRITYSRPGGYEIRESTLACTMDRQGRIVEASG